MKSIILQDQTLRDASGNGMFTMKLRRNGLLAPPSVYEISVTKDINKNTVNCVMKKVASQYKFYKYNLIINNNTKDICVYYEINDNGVVRKFNLMENDLMLTVKIKKEMLKVLREFDLTAVNVKNMVVQKSTMIDIMTDIIDLTEKNETEVDNVKYSDYELVNTVINGYFNEAPVNTDKPLFTA